MTVQRSYRAACPGCGAPVEFRSAASTHAVCGYCHSTVARDGEVLARLGKMADVFDDHSPLRLGVTGRYLGAGFVVVGRVQFRHANGVWSEWRLLFDDGSEAWLSEDNGSYVLSRAAKLSRELPLPGHFRVGMSTAIDGKPFVVGANESGITLLAAEGELDRLPQPGAASALVELRSERGDVLSIDYGRSPPGVQLGRGVELSALALQGLKDESAASYRGRQISCPNCGAPVQLQLANSRTVSCPSCRSMIRLAPPGSPGTADAADAGGGTVAAGHEPQTDPVEPLIPLGARARLQGRDWQVVGFQHRIGREAGDDEQFGWDEYLLYNQKSGFTFLVDATEGWSMGRVLTSAPPYKEGQKSVSYLGNTYRLDAGYFAETTWVAGEFYWPVQRGQRAWVEDFVNGRGILSRERTPGEVTWTRADRMDSAALVKAFGMAGREGDFKRGGLSLKLPADASPLSSGLWSNVGQTVFWLAIVMLILLLETRCTRCDPAVEDCRQSSASSGSGSSGGSWGGGFGGGHK